MSSLILDVISSKPWTSSSFAMNAGANNVRVTLIDHRQSGIQIRALRVPVTWWARGAQVLGNRPLWQIYFYSFFG